MAAPQVLVLILVIVTFSTDRVCSLGAVYPSENPVPVGNNVTLFSQTRVTNGLWSHMPNAIVIFQGTAITVAPNWTDRVELNVSTSALTIRSLQLKDSGKYVLQDLMSGGRAELTLAVEEIISNVTLRANSVNLVEFNDTAVLNCTVSSGSSLSYAWLKGSAVLTASAGVEFGDGGATLTMVNVTRDDYGPFRCNVSNGVSHEMSQPLYLNISYGPGNAFMTIEPNRSVYRSGSNIMLSCSAPSNPPATIQWVFESTYLNEFGPNLHLERVTQNQTGYYKCLFHNQVTSRFTSAHAMIRIVAPISAVVVEAMGERAIQDRSFALHCDVTGSVDHIKWWKDGTILVSSNRTVVDMENKTLTLTSVQKSDTGHYQCQAFNAVSNMTSSPYTPVISYGPGMPVITGPSIALEGQVVILNCSAASHPPSHFRWDFNGSLVSNSSEYVTKPLTLAMSGKYMCTAYNSVTGLNSTAYTMLTVMAPVTMATVKSVGAQPIENKTFSLTCDTAGSVKSIYWMLDRSPLHSSSRLNFSMDNATLTFDPVLLSDNGYYQCKASNPFSYLTSENYTLHVIYGPQNVNIKGPDFGVEGKSVKLTCSASSYPPSHFKWYFDHSIVANTSEYEVTNLTSHMSGKYICMAYSNISGHNVTAYHMLTVIAPITRVQVEAPSTPAISGHSYTLTCNVTGPVEHIYWMKNGVMLHAENGTVLSMDNHTLTLNPIDRYDSGEYKCKAFSLAEYRSSPSYTLSVNFGPDTPKITGPSSVVIGQNVTLVCFALSVPPSTYTWWFNGSIWAWTSEIMIHHLNMSGVFTCMAHNNVTKENSTSTKMLTVIEGIKSVMIKTNSIPINNENFTLTCEVIGPYDAIYWRMKLSNNVIVTITNKSLHFDPVSTNYDGIYQCVAINLIGPHSSPEYELLVNYGPLAVTITGPDSVQEGSTPVVTLTCSADSRPISYFQWYFNNQTMSTNESVINFPAMKEYGGLYTCKATNLVTGITMSKTNNVTITEHNSALRLQSVHILVVMALLALSVALSN
ncbi:cell adhesion molecule CEACAM5-like [Genypterus blacodes]|uniref:cell adhesion molecule CEACAM5-like n=1 Tax=Genypterus blacodes TaxID=154954 RepID=UPI003F76FB39